MRPRRRSTDGASERPPVALCPVPYVDTAAVFGALCSGLEDRSGICSIDRRMATRAIGYPAPRDRGALRRARPGPRPLLRRPIFWVAAILVVVLVGARLALDPIAARVTQRGLDALENYTGSFNRVRVGLFPPSYKILDLKLSQQGTDPDEPLVYVKELETRLIGRKLFKGQLVAVASLREPKFFIKPGVTQPPRPEEKKREAPEPSEDPLNTQVMLNRVIPLRIDRVEVRDGEMVLIDSSEPTAPRLWVKDIELVVENLATRRTLDEGLPQALTMRAVVERSGILKVMATADVLEDERPALTGQAQLTGLQLEHLHDWAAAKAGVAPKGTLDSFVNFSSAEGRVSGAVKVMVKNPTLEPAREGAGPEVTAAIGRMALKVLSDRVEGREAVAVTLPVKGTLKGPNAQIWPAVLSVVRNAFVQGLDWGFSDLPPETADEKQGPLEQAAEALDEKERAPKAQPRK